MLKAKKLYDMKLHETYQDEGQIIVLRVPGGWIYTSCRLDCNAMTSVFVPFNNEFMKEEN